MPAIKPTDLEQKRRTIRACVHSKQDLNGWNDKQLAAKCRVSTQTLNRRIDLPENFTLAELWNMGIVVYVHDGQSKLPTGDGLVALK